MSALVGDILANSEDDQYAPRRAYTLLTSIEAAAPDLESVSPALATATSAHPDVADHAEDDATQEQSAWGTAPPTTVDELHEKVSQELEATAQALIACEAERSSYEDQRRWDHLADAISSTVQRWPEDGYALLDSVGPGHPEVDQAVVRGWATTQPDADLAAQILTRLTNLELEPILGYVTATLGGFASAGSPPGKWFRFAESVELAKKCWDTIDPDTDPDTNSALTSSKDSS